MLVVSADKKQVSSSVGMQRSVLTSTLMSHRVGEVVPQRMVAMETSVQQRDFQTFAQLTMQVCVYVAIGRVYSVCGYWTCV